MRQTRQTSQSRRRSVVDGPSIQVICLASGGGPSENNVSGFLVRSTASKWTSGSILAVDAGSHLAPITEILDNHFPRYAPQTKTEDEPPTSDLDESLTRSESSESPSTVLTEGPFAGLPFPYASSRANALHIVREHVATYLITHPHLDHLAGFAINTAAFHNNSRPKRLAALPFTVNAIKQHIFNDVIWPNLTDEDDGVGFVSFQRLTEGGNNALGDGYSRGYIEVCHGLATKGYRVSHGSCASKPPMDIAPSEPSSRRASIPQKQELSAQTCVHASAGHALVRTPTISESISRRTSGFTNSQPPTPIAWNQQEVQARSSSAVSCVVDSTAYFIRAERTGREVLIWGDVEPDSLSHLPRNHIVWAEAAIRIVRGTLGGVLIECSFDDSQPDAVLFGHLSPRHVIAELTALADMVVEAKERAANAGADSSGNARARASSSGSGPGAGSSTKRKRQYGLNHILSQDTLEESPSESAKRRGGGRWQHSDNPSPTTSSGSYLPQQATEHLEADMTNAFSPTATSRPTTRDDGESPPPSLPSRPPNAPTSHPTAAADSRDAASVAATKALKGLKVIIIHVKDNMEDGPSAQEIILAELLEHEAELQARGRGLGCEFEIVRPGQSYWF